MNKIKVLWGDDQLQLANELKNILQTDEDLEVVAVAKDGFDGLTQMRQTPVDVVLMDIRMPNMNGVVATQRIKTPIIFIASAKNPFAVPSSGNPRLLLFFAPLSFYHIAYDYTTFHQCLSIEI